MTEPRLDIWKFFDVTHKYHAVLNPMSITKIDELIELLNLKSQAEVLDKRLNHKNCNITTLNLDVEDDEIIERIINRLVCRECGATFHKIFLPPKHDNVCDKCGGELYQRKDDTEAVVKERLTAYHTQTQPLLKYYSHSKNVSYVNIPAEGPKEEIFHHLLQAIKKQQK